MSEITLNLNKWSTKFYLAKEQKICLTGEFGSGKTTIAGIKFNEGLTEYPGTVGVVLRNLGNELDTATIPQYFELVFGNRQRPPYPVYYHSTKKHVRYPNGSEIWFLAMDDEKSLRKLKNIVIGLLWVEQVEEIKQEVLTMADGRVRQKGAPLQRILTANPEGGDHYLKDMFYVKPIDVQHLEIENSPCQKANGQKIPYGIWQGKDKDHLGIVCKQKANAENLPKGYYENLERNFPYAWVMKYVYSSWFGKSGLIYDIENAFINKLPFNLSNIPFPATLLEVGDYAISDTSAMVWLQIIFHDGIYYIISELYEFNSSLGNLLEHIKNNTEFTCDRKQLKAFWRIGCPRMFQKEGTSAGVSRTAKKLTPADLLANEKVYVSSYAVHVTTRQTILEQVFSDGRIKIYNCPNLEAELKKYKWSDLKNAIAHAIEAMERIISKHELYLRQGNFEMPKDEVKPPNSKSELRTHLANSNYMNHTF